MPITVLILIVMLGSMGSGLVIPVFPSLLESVSSSRVSDVSQMYGGLIATYTIFTFVSAPQLGALSDRFGRRRIILLTLIGAGAAYLIQAWATQIWMLFLARALGGVCAANQVVATAYISDLASPEERTKKFGAVSVGAAIGLAVGPLIGGVLGERSPRLPFLFAAMCVIVTSAVAVIALPKTDGGRRLRKVSWSDFIPQNIWGILRERKIVRSVFLAISAITLSMSISQVSIILFMKDSLHFSNTMIGVWMVFFSVSVIFSQSVIIVFLKKKMRDEQVLYLSAVFCILAAFCAMFLGGVWGVCIFACILGLVSIGSPSALSVLSREVPVAYVGEVQGAVSGVGNLLAAVGAFAGAASYGYFSRASGAVQFIVSPFTISSVITVVSVIFLFPCLWRSSDLGPREN